MFVAPAADAGRADRVLVGVRDFLVSRLEGRRAAARRTERARFAVFTAALASARASASALGMKAGLPLGFRTIVPPISSSSSSEGLGGWKVWDSCESESWCSATSKALLPAEFPVVVVIWLPDLRPLRRLQRIASLLPSEAFSTAAALVAVLVEALEAASEAVASSKTVAAVTAVVSADSVVAGRFDFLWLVSNPPASFSPQILVAEVLAEALLALLVTEQLSSTLLERDERGIPDEAPVGPKDVEIPAASPGTLGELEVPIVAPGILGPSSEALTTPGIPGLTGEPLIPLLTPVLSAGD